MIAHIVVGEAFWADYFVDCGDGVEMVPPPFTALGKEFESTTDFQGLAHKAQADNMRNFRALSATQLAKRIVWAKREWTVMGFLWGAFAHRAFHIGNIDIYLRQADVVAPEFFEFNPANMA